MEMRASSEVGFSALCRHSFVRMSDKVRHLGCSLKTPPLGPSAPLRKGFFFFMAQPPLLFRGCCKTLKGRGRNHKKHKKHKNSCAFLCILCFLWFLPRFSFGFCNTLFQGESVARIRPVLPEALRLPHFLVSICRKHSGSRTCWPALRSSHIQFVCKARRTRSDAGQAGGRRLPPVFWSARSATDFLEAFSSLSHIENRDPFSEPGNRNNTRIHPRDILTWN